MDDAALGAAIRALRHRRGWRQVDLALRAKVSRALLRAIEAGRLDRVSLPAVRRVASALDMLLRWDAGFRGSELARLRDADHARLAEFAVRRLERLGWIVMAEVSFNNYGERGRIDLLAYHPATRTLLVVEVKTVIVEVQSILGGLSVKQRVAPGWRAHWAGVHRQCSRRSWSPKPRQTVAESRSTDGFSPCSRSGADPRSPGCERREADRMGCWSSSGCHMSATLTLGGLDASAYDNEGRIHAQRRQHAPRRADCELLTSATLTSDEKSGLSDHNVSQAGIWRERPR
ncbi:MAG TPA: helix-turn-helix domain-containing protein [Candidatus Limnocylindria bacterium]|nr:helix-turn-helix domain-containing protein [Candidatus Limnocylindria bacterium]